MDIIQQKCEAVLLQAMLMKNWATFDVVRRVVPIPEGYSLNKIACVPSRMRRAGLVAKVGFAVSGRRAAKNGTNRIWRLLSRTIGQHRLQSLRDELGKDFPAIDERDLEAAKPREVHWRPSSKRKPLPSQGRLFNPHDETE